MGLFKKKDKEQIKKAAQAVKEEAAKAAQTVKEEAAKAAQTVKEEAAKAAQTVKDEAAKVRQAAADEEAKAEQAAAGNASEASVEPAAEVPAEPAAEAITEPEAEVPAEPEAEVPAEQTDGDPYGGMLHIIDHPLVQHKLTIMRAKDTGAKDFRELLDEIAMLVGYEVTRELPLCDVEIETPIKATTGKAIAGKKLAVVPILRAGLGMVDGLLRLVPAAKVGHIGLYRDPETHKPITYYCKLPDDIQNRLVIISDPMLATGGSAIAAIDMLKEKGCNDLRMMCLVAAPEGVKALHEAHPDVPVFTAALDECLNENAYIVPGLGDAGDRIFGTY